MVALKPSGMLLAMMLAAPAMAAERSPYGPEITAAAQRFNLPADWIRAVIQAESGGDPHAVSPKGALGLMQLMPDTWVEMCDRYGIAGDVFDPAANIMAGAAYLAEMQERFGFPGLFAAYNAGPGRYEAYLRNAVPLPAETKAYLAGLSTQIGAEMGGTQRLFVPLEAADGRLFVPISRPSDRR